MSTTPTYDALPVDQRLAIERLLYERMTGSPYAERSIPHDASDKKKEYLVSCIRDAVHLLKDAAVPPQKINPIRELSARSAAGGVAELVAPEDASARLAKRLLEAAGRAPNDLDRLTQEALKDLARAAEGEKVEGLGELSQLGIEKGVPRNQIAAKALAPLGYALDKKSAGPGYAVFLKETPTGRFRCTFDFGSWRNSVLAGFMSEVGGLRLGAQIPYKPSPGDTPILTRALLERTMENVVFVLQEAEKAVAPL